MEGTLDDKNLIPGTQPSWAIKATRLHWSDLWWHILITTILFHPCVEWSDNSVSSLRIPKCDWAQNHIVQENLFIKSKSSYPITIFILYRRRCSSISGRIQYVVLKAPPVWIYLGVGSHAIKLVYSSRGIYLKLITHPSAVKLFIRNTGRKWGSTPGISMECLIEAVVHFTHPVFVNIWYLKKGNNFCPFIPDDISPRGSSLAQLTLF